MNKALNSIYAWWDADKVQPQFSPNTYSINYIRCVPFVVIHMACISAFWIEFNYQLVVLCLLSYLSRMFFITGFYHRHFSHRSYKTHRITQFIFAILGATAVQRGPLWWSAHHRHHHAHSDTKNDRHSPLQHGFVWSHFAWFFDDANFATDKKLIKDLLKFPELVFINRFDIIIPILYAGFLYLLGGLPYLIWGFFISTVILYHATFSINSWAHRFGKRKFDTNDNSKNHFLLALITLGEGWHNNHHYFPSSARQGFAKREIDISYIILRLLEFTGLIWDLRLPPKEVLHAE